MTLVALREAVRKCGLKPGARCKAELVELLTQAEVGRKGGKDGGRKGGNMEKIRENEENAWCVRILWACA
jgi:hypothetical protein